MQFYLSFLFICGSISLATAGFFTKDTLTWTVTSAPTNSWSALCANMVGDVFIAAGVTGGIYKSTDYGESWALSSAPTTGWSAVACSSTGQTIAAIENTTNTSAIYISNDLGDSWTLASTPAGVQWSSIAANSSGMQLVAGATYGDASTGGVYISVDFGVSWTKTGLESVDRQYDSIATSDSGAFIYCTYNNFSTGERNPHSYVTLSSDYGGNFHEASEPDVALGEEYIWHGIISDASGEFTYAIADGTVTEDHLLYLGYNYGNNWTVLTNNSYPWGKLANSGSGKYVTATAENDVYFSADFGVTFENQNIATSNGLQNWLPVACNGSGFNVVAGQSNGGLYLGTNTSSVVATDDDNDDDDDGLSVDDKFAIIGGAILFLTSLVLILCCCRSSPNNNEEKSPLTENFVRSSEMSATVR